jgi:hypothetical protein
MIRNNHLSHEFVEFIPDSLVEGKLYISMQFSTAIHKCCCGCGIEVVTPFSPTDWKLIFNGVSISLTPSIGNWNFKCRSHYWIKEGQIIWASDMSSDQINIGRKHDQLRKAEQFNQQNIGLLKNTWRTIQKWWNL